MAVTILTTTSLLKPLVHVTKFVNPCTPGAVTDVDVLVVVRLVEGGIGMEDKHGNGGDILIK
jgi:hypothetical protein